VRGQYRGRKPEGQEHVRREIQNTKVREKKARGEKISTHFLSLVHRVLLLF
jgi:hypothetical protein